MVHPLVVDATAFDAPALRGALGPSAALQQSLDGLRASSAAHPESPTATAALISGYQAVDQLQNARAHLDVALTDHPDDPILRDLEVAQLYREGRFDAAEARLRAQREQDPQASLTALNLLILMAERGDPDDRPEMRRLREEILTREGDSALGRRAARIAV